MSEFIKPTKAQLAAIYFGALSFHVYRLAPLVVMLLMLHYSGLPGFFATVLCYIVGFSVIDVNDELAKAKLTAELMAAFNAAVAREQGESK